MKSLMSVFFQRRTSLRIILVYNSINLLVAIAFYPLIPFMLNYPPGTINTEFDSDCAYITYTQQYILAAAFIILIGFILLGCLFVDIDCWEDAVNDNSTEGLNKIHKIRKKCINYPYIIYLAQIALPFIIISVVLLVTDHFPVVIYKILILVVSFGTLAASISYIFSKRIFTKILISTYKGQGLEGHRIGLGKTIILHILPMIFVSILFTSLLGYSRLVNEKGKLIASFYKEQLNRIFDDKRFLTSEKDFFSKAVYMQTYGDESTKDCSFVIYPDKRVITSDGSKISSFFSKYVIELSEKNNNRVYDYYCIDTQGVVLRLSSKYGACYVGFKYEVVSNDTLMLFIIGIILLIGINLIILSYFSNSIVEDISRVTKNLLELVECANVDFDKRLEVVSNDEMGDLIVAFNKIQQREKEIIAKIEQNQAILLEQERLASLGQLIGGIAHNLKTPIMSLSGGIEALKDLTDEYENSIDDASVTKEDHHEIAAEMKEWLDKMKPYCAYMSDIISAVKGQAVQMNASSTAKFTVDELVKRVDLLMKHELKKYHCAFNKDFQIDMNTEIKGEINNLVQVFDNIIMNAVQAYEGKEGIIDFIITRNGDIIEFAFRDYAKGIPAGISEKLFKEMITTKGKNGTGLGLYISYATVKGRLGGNMTFTSKEGAGTSFLVSIPCITYNKEAAI